MLRMLSLFSGIGAFETALRRGGHQFEIVNYCEIDPYASKAYSQIHDIPEGKNLHDVREINPLLLDNINLVTYGFPCQDISVAGKQKGFEYNGERTRSGLFFEALRIIEFLQPEYAIAENVKALTSKKFEKEFNTVLNSLSEVGYNNYWKVLNAKDYGIPQNRERVFIVSIRKDVDDHNFFFPQPMPLLIRLKDVLEQKVDEKFYLKSERADKLIESLVQTYSPNISGENKIMALGHLGVGGQKGWVFDVNGISRCLAATDYKDPTKVMLVPPGINSSEDLPKKIEEPHVDRLGNLYDENAGGARAGNVYNASGLSPTLQTAQGGNRMPLITEPIIAASRGRNPDNPGDRTTGLPTEQRLEVNTQGMSNTLTTVQKDNLVVEPQILKYERTEYAKSIRKEYENGELSERRCNMRQYTTRKDGTSNTLTTVQKDNYLLEPKKILQPIVIGSTQKHASVNTDGTAPCLTAMMGLGGGNVPMITDNQQNDCSGYRIRKLTPLECFRLMGFSDEEFNRIKGVSNTQLYKMAGNSIVVNVLEGIFRELFKAQSR